MGDDQIARLRFARHRIEKVAKAVDIGIVQRRIDLVEHADRCGIGQEQREDQRGCGQRLFAARQQGERLQFLARRLGEDFEPGLERIVAVDQRQMRLASFEQAGEEPFEVGVDLLERGAQALAALAVEIADRSAQPAHRLAQFLLFGRVGAMLALDPLQFLGCDQIDRPDPLAAGGQAVHFFPLGLGGTERLLVEFEPGGQQRGRALEALARNPRHFDPAAVLILCPFRQASPAFARIGQPLIGGGKGMVGLLRGGIGLADGFLGFGKVARQALAHLVALFDLAHQAFGLGGGDRALLRNFFRADFHLRQAPRRIAAARLPVGHVAALGRSPFARDRQRLVVAGKFGRARLQSRAGGFVLRPGRFQRSASGLGIGQGVALCFGRGQIGFGGSYNLALLDLAAIEFREPRGEPFARCLRLIERAQRLPFRIGGTGQLAIGRDEIALKLPQLLAHSIERLPGSLGSLAERGEAAVEFGEAVFRFQSRGFRRAFTTHHETIPPAQMAVQTDQRMAGGQHAPVIDLGDMHQCQQGAQFVGTGVDMSG